jgi:hypothetical protein
MVRTRGSLAGQKTGRQWLTVRVSPDVRRALEEAAARSGRAISSEAEHALERALRDERSFDDNLVYVFGRQGGALLEVIGFMMRQRGDWLDDPAAFAAMRRRVDLVFDAVAPAGVVPADGSVDADVEALLGRLFRVNPNAVWFRWAIHLHERLGAGAATRIMRWIAGRQA